MELDQFVCQLFNFSIGRYYQVEEMYFPHEFVEFLQKKSIGGSVVEFSPATRETRVRFPANAAEVVL